MTADREIDRLRRALADAEAREKLERLIGTWWVNDANPLIPRINQLARLDLEIAQTTFGLDSVEEVAALAERVTDSIDLYRHLEGQLGEATLHPDDWPTITEAAIAGPGQKAPKPRELRGIKPVGKIAVGGSAREGRQQYAQVFLPPDGSVWVHHPVYRVHTVDLGPAFDGADLPTKLDAVGKARALKRFVYSDAWGPLLSRWRAWLKIEGVCPFAPFSANLGTLMRVQEGLMGLPAFFLEVGSWQRFYADLVSLIRRERACECQCEEREIYATDEAAAAALAQYIHDHMYEVES